MRRKVRNAGFGEGGWVGGKITSGEADLFPFQRNEYSFDEYSAFFFVVYFAIQKYTLCLGQVTRGNQERTINYDSYSINYVNDYNLNCNEQISCVV